MPSYIAQQLLARLGPLSERMSFQPVTGQRVLPAREVLQKETLLSLLYESARHQNTENLAAVGSVWNKRYNAALLYPVLGAMTMAGVGLNAAIDRVSILFSEHGQPLRSVWPEPLDAVVHAPRASCGTEGIRAVALDGLHRCVWQSAIADHLSHVVQRLHETVRVPRRVLWGNAGNLIADLYDRIAEQPDLRSAVAEDRQAILESPSDPCGAGRNPLCGAVRYEQIATPERLVQVRCRRSCCQRYHIPGTRHCYTCPLLPAEERVRLLLDSR